MKFANKQKVETLVGKGAALIDLRTPVDFRDGTIGSAINLPYRNFINSLLKFDKTKTMVIIVDSVDSPDLKSVDTFLNNLSFEKVWAAEYRQLKEPVDKRN